MKQTNYFLRRANLHSCHLSREHPSFLSLVALLLSFLNVSNLIDKNLYIPFLSDSLIISKVE